MFTSKDIYFEFKSTCTSCGFNLSNFSRFNNPSAATQTEVKQGQTPKCAVMSALNATQGKCSCSVNGITNILGYTKINRITDI